MEQLYLFCKELDAIGVSYTFENENIILEYSFEAVDQKNVNRLLNQYVGFWRSIGIKTDHSKDNKIAKYIIPVDWIEMGNLTDEQVLDAAEYIKKRLENVSISHIDYTKHPNLSCQIKQDEFLKNCPKGERERLASNFRIGNAIYTYHQQAFSEKDEWLRFYYNEWLEGLPPNIAVHMREYGFDYCKTTLSFLRYVNERKDLGLKDWLKEHLSEEDFLKYQKSDENSQTAFE